jgi:phosphoglucosamine mutase
MHEWFGTDGIRQAVNVMPMNVETVLQIGMAIGRYFLPKKHAPILVGTDTRQSRDMFAHALAAGISAVGADVVLLGVVPTPGVAYLVRHLSASAGVVVSASHNPYTDNGIKLFDAAGFKLSRKQEEAIESLIIEARAVSRDTSPGMVRYEPQAISAYRDFLMDSVDASFSLQGIHIVLDCANGAASSIAQEVFEGLGVRVDCMDNHPNGTNINEHCGSEHPEGLAKRVLQSRAAVGFAFDGDADRVVAVDDTGKVLTGDQLIAIFADHFRRSGRLGNKPVVTTVMSNMGLGVMLKQHGIAHIRCKVGDRHVMETMKGCGAILGGEDSGHILFLDRHTTGDGMLSAITLLNVLSAEDRALSEMASIMSVFPQMLVNVPVSHKPELELLPNLQAEIRRVEEQLGNEGRVLIRYSGTQPLCRVMVEGPSKSLVYYLAETLAGIVRREIG